MHFSTTTIITIGALCSSIGAAPAPNTGHPFPAAVQKLDADGKITWTSTDSGGRTAEIPFDDIASVETDAKIKQVRALSGVSGWTNLGQIADKASQNHEARYACQKTGSYAKSSLVAETAKVACKELVNMVPGANKAWAIWQGAKDAATETTQAKAAFRFFYKTANAPKLDETLCNEAMAILTETACQGKEDNKDKSQGGEIKIGDGEDYIQVGFDPVEPVDVI
ncbi:MAG: hypothetical protein Q9178_008076, partial [Gyalolechia marmorata]